MTAITTAARLLRVAADELKNAHTLGGDWGNEHEALDAYNEHMATATTLEHMARQCLQQIEEPAGAAPAAVAGPAWDKTRDSLATMLLRLARHPFLNFDVACIALDAATQPGMPLGYMRGAPAAPALEAPAAPEQAAQVSRQPDYPEGHVLRNWAQGWNECAEYVERDALAAAPQAPAAPWKDHLTARLVNDLRDCAIKYHGAGQLRERIAHIVVPLCDQLKGALAAPAAPAVDAQPLIARSIAEWHEDDGDVSWWAWCGHGWAGEPAWIGRPTDDGWPGYHTHWTAHPAMPPAIAAQAAAKGTA